MSSEKRSISAPADLLARADVRYKKLRYPKFSHYVQALIEADVTNLGDHVRSESGPGALHESSAIQSSVKPGKGSSHYGAKGIRKPATRKAKKKPSDGSSDPSLQ